MKFALIKKDIAFSKYSATKKQRNMKKNILLLIVLFSLLQAACDPCVSKKCLNGADCDNGICYCATGYTGETCETEWSTKFVKGFSNVQDSAGVKPLYGSDITRIDAQNINISNLGDFTNTLCNNTSYRVKARLLSIYKFKIDEATLCGNYKIIGEGNYDPATKKLIVNYTVNGPAFNQKRKDFFQY